MAATRRRCKQELNSKKVIQPKGDARKDCLETIQKNIEDGAKEIAHNTKLERDRDARRVPTKIVAQEKAATRSLRPVERRVLRRQARKARAANLVKCSLAPGWRRVLGKPLKELYINGEFSENREDWRKELERPWREVYVDRRRRSRTRGRGSQRGRTVYLKTPKT